MMNKSQKTKKQVPLDTKNISCNGGSGTRSVRSIVDEVYDKTLSRIVLGQYNPNDVLVCTKLAEDFGVSRTPVVAAIDRLANDGILIKEKNQRARIIIGAEKWLLQIHQLRQYLEPPAAALAAIHITDEAIEHLRVLAELAEPTSDTSWMKPASDFDFALHLSIAEHSQNIPLRDAIERCWRFKVVSYELGCSHNELEEIGYREHLAILAALSQRDPETASAAMFFHLRSSLSTVVSRIV